MLSFNVMLSLIFILFVFVYGYHRINNNFQENTGKVSLSNGLTSVSNLLSVGK